VEPLITNRLDPALLRVVDKRGSERDPTPRRRRATAPEKSADATEESTDLAKHELDDMA